MRYTTKTIHEVRRCIAGFSGQTRVEVEGGIPVKTKTVADLREAVRDYIMKKKVRRLSRVDLDALTAQSTDLATLVEFALTRDPGAYLISR